jgi:hypothetical protein
MDKSVLDAKKATLNQVLIAFWVVLVFSFAAVFKRLSNLYIAYLNLINSRKISCLSLCALRI